MYEFLLSLHLLSAVMWAGGGVTLHILGRRAGRAGGERMATFTREAGLIAPRFYAPLALVLLVTGLLLVDEAGYDFAQAWISIGLTGWLVAFAIVVVFYGGQQKRLEGAIAAEGEDAGAVRSVYKRVITANQIEIAVLLLVVVDMAVKPGV